MTQINSELKLFVFQVSGIKFGADSEQLLELIDLKTAENEGIRLRWFHEMVPFRKKKVVYKIPRVIILKGDENFGVIIDSPEDVFSVESREVLPLPQLLEATIQNRFIRGGVMMKDQVVLLVDFQKAFEYSGQSCRPGGEVKQ